MKSRTRSFFSVFKSVLTVSVFSVFLISAMGAAQASAAGKPKVHKFTLQHMFSMNHPATVALNEMAASLDKDTGGRIKIQILPPGALVKETNTFETVGNGAIQMGTSCSCYHAGFLPVAATAFALPGDPRGVDDILDFIYKEETLKFFRDIYATKNVFYGAPIVMDGYTIVSKKPIQTLEDLKKLKVRASGTVAKTLQKMGIPTVFIPFSEIYVALSRGTIDAEISGNHAESYLVKTYEVAKFQTDPPISGAQNCEIILNLDQWKALDDLQPVMDKALKTYAFRVAELFAKENKEVRAKMEAAGTQYIDLPKPVMDQWVSTAVSVWEDDLAKDPLSAQYIEMVKKDLKERGYRD